MVAEAVNWGASILCVAITVLIQFSAQVVLMRGAPRVRRTRIISSWPFPHDIRVTVFAVFVLLTGHLAQVMVWAVFFYLLGHMATFDDAIYFSMANFSSVGTDSPALSEDHRVLGPVECIVATLMFGWSTALLVTLVARSGNDEPAPPSETEGEVSAD